jgi:hypothetical protein
VECRRVCQFSFALRLLTTARAIIAVLLLLIAVSLYVSLNLQSYAWYRMPNASREPCERSPTEKAGLVWLAHSMHTVFEEAGISHFLL